MRQRLKTEPFRFVTSMIGVYGSRGRGRSIKSKRVSGFFVFAKENELDNCVLVNENKNVVEVANGNLFIVKGNVIKTPPLSDGCLKGVGSEQQHTHHMIWKSETCKFRSASILGSKNHLA